MAQPMRVSEFPAMLTQARRDADAARARRADPNPNPQPAAEGRLILGDNLDTLATLTTDATESAAFIYLDPPFASAADYRSRITTQLADGTPIALERHAYRDRWSGGLRDYLAMLAPRLLLARDALASDGAICVHIDWHAAHWVRLLLDELFGAEHFVNHLVWSYRSGGASRTSSVPRKHDDLFIYRRGPGFRVRPLFERQYLDRPFIGSRVDAQGRHYVDTILRDVLEGGYTLVAAGAGDDATGERVSVRPVLNVSAERTGYASQKPEGLLELLLRWFTDPGDLVFDPFGGAGTTAAVAARLGRRWCSVDANPQAVATTRARLDAAGVPYSLAPWPAERGSMRAELVDSARLVRLTAAEVTLPGTLRPARGAAPSAVELVRDDPLAGVAGWGVYRGEQRLAAAWRDARGALAAELALPAGVRIHDLTLHVIDLAGDARQMPLDAAVC